MADSSSPRSLGDSPRAASTADSNGYRQEPPIGSPGRASTGGYSGAGGDSLCQRVAKANKKNRHAPYDRSPGGSSCTSESDDNFNAEDGDGEVPGVKKWKRVQANCRERKRMHTVNSAFDQLRELVPTYPSNRKLSKIDTLRLACTYIQDLTSLVRTSAVYNLPGEDVKLYAPPCTEGFLPSPPACNSPPTVGYASDVQVKLEAAPYGTQAEYPTCSSYQHYRLGQQNYLSVSLS